MQMANPPMDHMPPHQSWGGPPQGHPPASGGGPGFGHNPQYMPPPRQLDNYYPPAEVPPPPMDKQPHHGILAYGREAPLPVHASSNAQTAPSMVTQVIFCVPYLFCIFAHIHCELIRTIYSQIISCDDILKDIHYTQSFMFALCPHFYWEVDTF